VRAVAGDRVLAPLLLCSAAFVLIAGGVNVWELMLLRTILHAGATGYALAVTAMSAGIGAGALIAARVSVRDLRTGYGVGLAACAAGLVMASWAMHAAVALVAFALFGLGNGAALTCERLLIQRRFDGAMRGRAFGVRASLVAFALNGSFLIAAVGGSQIGTRLLLACAGAATALVAIAATLVAGAGGSPRIHPRRAFAGKHASNLRIGRSTSAQGADGPHRYVTDSTRPGPLPGPLVREASVDK
jgi:MFS family permease